MPENRTLRPPLDANATTDGSGTYVGDGVIITAGHVWLEFEFREI